MIEWFRSKEVAMQAVKPVVKGDNFISLASHELRSPLSIVKWYTEMLLDGDGGDLTQDQTKYLRIIQSANQRSIDLVRSLLNVSRLDLGTFIISPTINSLPAISREVIDALKGAIDDAHVTLKEEYQSDIKDIMVDKQMCIVIMRNILSNAISFSKEDSEVLVHLFLVEKSQSVAGVEVVEDSILFSVHDSGIGIPDEDKEKVFTKLFRASNVKDSGSTGSGLGLYTTQAIVSAVGGQIWFISKKEEGTTFYVTFPVKGMPAKEGTTRLD